MSESKASDVLVRALEAEGVERIFGVPGEENLDLLESLRRSSISLILVRHEQAAAFMAAAHGRLTGTPGVCLSTLGPGATNLLTGVAYAHLGGMPLVCLTGQKPIGPRDQGAFQIIDVVGLMKTVTKKASSIRDPDDIPAMIREAFRIATREKPGPVHLELPQDVAGMRTHARPLDRSPRPTVTAASPADLDDAVLLIANARSPLIAIASGANRFARSGDEGMHLQDAVKAFVEASGLPFLTTQMGKGVIDDAHPQCLGTATLSSGGPVHAAIDAADLIINVGHDVVEKPPFVMEGGAPRVMHVAFEPADFDPVYHPRCELIGDLPANLLGLATRLEGSRREWPEVMSSVQRAFARTHTRDDATDDATDPAHPRRIIGAIRAALPAEAVVSLDNGMYKLWFARYFRAELPHTLLLDNALATMGAGLPVAIGAKLVRPDVPVVAVAGDGGFSMNSAELETAVRLGLDLVVIVLRNDALQMIRWKQDDEGFEDFGLAFGNPDFVALAEAYGATGHRCDGASLEQSVRDAVDAGGVHLLEVRIAPDYDAEEFG